MSSLLNSGYTNMNDLIYINADNIDTNSISTNSLYLNNVLLDLTNYATSSQLADTNANVNILQVKLSTCTFNSSTLEFQINGDMKVANNFVLYMSGANVNVGNFITNTNSSITSINSSISTINTKLTDVSRDVGLGAFVLGGTSDMRLSNKLYLVINGYPADINTYIQNNIININSLLNKTNDISYSGTTTTIGNNLVINNIDGFTKAQFDNAINFTYNLTSNAQTQITAAQATATAAGVAVAATDIAVAGIAADLVLTNAALVLTDANVATNTADITTLETKTQTYSYDVANNIVNIASRFNANSFGSITFNGSLNQNSVNAQNDLYGNTYYHNHLRSANGAAIFGDALSASSTLDVTGVSTLNGVVNINNSLNIYNVNTQIRNNLTTASGTLAPYFKIQNISTNNNAFKLQGMIIGKENIFGTEQSNCNLGYNFVSDGSTTNYGYLGLNVNTANNNTLECIRFSSAKTTIQTGNFEVVNNASVIGSITCNTINNSGAANSAPLAITTTGTNNNIVITSVANTNLFGAAVKLNSNDVQIGSNQGAGVNNTVLIGSTTSNTTINIPNGIKTNTLTPFNTGNAVNINGLNLNLATSEATASNNVVTIGSINALTTTNVPYLFKTNSISGYNTATALSLNNGVINIGYNQGIAANNVVNIGALTSNTAVNINGQLTLNYGLGTINVNSVLSQFI